MNTLFAALAAFRKPMLVAHGDRPRLRVETYHSPLNKPTICNVARVPRVGSPFVNWVKVTVRVGSRDSAFGQIRWVSVHSSEIAQRP